MERLPLDIRRRIIGLVNDAKRREHFERRRKQMEGLFDRVQKPRWYLCPRHKPDKKAVMIRIFLDLPNQTSQYVLLLQHEPVMAGGRHKTMVYIQEKAPCPRGVTLWQHSE